MFQKRGIMVSEIFKICVAYEQGLGDGLYNKKEPNPYHKTADTHEAWDIGYRLGKEKAKEVDEKLLANLACPQSAKIEV